MALTSDVELTPRVPLTVELQHALTTYEAESSAGTPFVEIQHTMLFATVGQRT